MGKTERKQESIEPQGVFSRGRGRRGPEHLRGGMEGYDVSEREYGN